MAADSKIEWTDATWNPITGCSVKSPGCANCYAMGLAGTRLQHHPSRAGLTRPSHAGPVWTGEVRFNRQWLDQPLRWRRPRHIFVCAHGDLFHESVPDAWIDRVFAVMALAPRHTFQVLTKRADRMRAYMTTSGVSQRIWYAADATACERNLSEFDPAVDYLLAGAQRAPWPLPNVWLLVSVEDQRRADERIPDLLATPAAGRGVSAEPLLGPLLLDAVQHRTRDGIDLLNALTGARSSMRRPHGAGLPKIDWVIAGGESGPGARPMHPDWARSVRDQCAAAGVPFFFKQWGEWAPADDYASETQEDFDVRGLTAGSSIRTGRKAAGRTLDGVVHDGYPA